MAGSGLTQTTPTDTCDTQVTATEPVRLPAGPCDAALTALNLGGSSEGGRPRLAPSKRQGQMVGTPVISLPRTWPGKSSVGYAGKPGPGASRLVAGSRLPTGA